jgi:outer membrane murein-binding lipoprotein Lpp
MRQAALIAVCSVVAAVLAGAYVNANAAPAATPIAKKVAVLSTQVKTLQSQVKALQKQGKTLRTELTQFEAGAILLQLCSTEVLTDAVQGTWTTFDSKSGTTFGAQQPVTDPISTAAGRQVCGAFNVTRQSVQAVPSAAAVQALLSSLSGRSASARSRVLRAAALHGNG